MTDALKNFLEYASKNEQVISELKSLDTQDKDEQALMAAAIALAKKYGFTLTQEDFESAKQKLDEAELDNVAGGSDNSNGFCCCPSFGYGKTDDGTKCVCVGGGGGASGGKTKCACVGFGEGADI